MDETGHSGDTGSAESGSGADSRDRALLNGWATSDSPWSNAGSALDPEEDVPAWRRPSQEIRPFTRQNFPPERSADGNRQFGTANHSGEVRPFGSPPNPFADESRSGDIRAYGDSRRSGEIRPYGDGGRSGEITRPQETGPAEGDGVDSPTQEAPAPQWSDNRTRYSDLLHHFSPNSEPTGAPTGATTGAPAAPTRPGSLEDDDRRTLSPLDAPPPSSAPPYPYEGDLDDHRRADPPVVQQRAAVPLERPQRAFPAVRPATPGGRRVDWSTGDWSTPDSARHSVDPAPDGVPPADPADQETASGEPARVRPSYDPVTFPRRLPYTPTPPAGSAPPAATPSGYAAPTAFSGFTGRSAGDPGGTPIGEQIARALPKRVPAEPDVPTVPEPPAVEPPAETPALARIATHLRRGDVLPSQERQEGFDVTAILAAVREVDGVRDASLRSTPAGAHSLRLDLAEGADPAEVSRQVARLLQDRMGLDAAMPGEAARTPPPAAAPPAPPVTGSGPANTAPISAFVPSQSGPSGRASVPKTGAAAPRGEDLRRLPTAPQAGPGPMTVDESPIHPVSSLPGSPAAQISPAPATPVASTATGTAPVAGPATADPAENRSGTVETVSSGLDCGPPRPLSVREQPGPRVVIENVQVNTFGTEATVEVRLAVGGRTAAGIASGPSVDGYLLRLCAMATAGAVDELLASADHADGPARCFVEHAASVPFGAMQVAVVVLLLSCGGSWVEQLAGSAVVSGDDRHAMVRATLAAVNRRLEALLS